MSYWLPRKGMKVVNVWAGPLGRPYTLLRRLGVYRPLPENERWEARSPGGAVVKIAVGTFYVPWEGRR